MRHTATLCVLLLVYNVSMARASILPERSPAEAVRLAELADATYLPADKLDAVLVRRGFAKQLVIDHATDTASRQLSMTRSTFLFTARAVSERSGVAKGSLVLGIRGSHTANDWYTNAHVGLRTWRAGSAEGHGKIHAGFLAVARVALDCGPLVDSIKSSNRVYIVGHSLGGAAGVIVAAHLLEMGVPSEKLRVFTFGAPRPGDAEFAGHYAPRLDFYEYRNSKDPFFSLPSRRFFSHLCDARPERFIGLSRSERSINDIVSNPSDHHMWSYVYRMHGKDVDILSARFSLPEADIKLPFALPQRLTPVLRKWSTTSQELRKKLEAMLE